MSKYRYAYTGKIVITVNIPRSATLQDMLNYIYPMRQGYRYEKAILTAID